MRFRFLRLATLYFEPALRHIPKWTIASDESELQVLRSWDLDSKKTRLLVCAMVDLDGPLELDEHGSVVVSTALRNAAESQIEGYANLIAVGEMCKRTISSPSPAVALQILDDEGRDWLADKNGIAQNSSIEPSLRFDVPSEALESLINERLDGVALLAESISHDNASGQFRDYVRLFELAFARSGKELVDPLTAFLTSGFMHYSEDEVCNWLLVLRHQSSHADLKYQARFILSSEVRPVVARVHQAAYDVLFNKTSWRDDDSARRSLWKPVAYVSPPGASTSMVLQQHSTPVMEARLLDGFGAYPMDLSASLDQMPSDWWAPWPAREPAGSA